MEAKDTVLTETQRLDIELRVDLPVGFSADRLINEICQAQAEISFKVGMEYALTKEGVKASLDSIIKRERLAVRREVVEWIGSQRFEYTIKTGSFYRITDEQWQAKLKEWGIK